MNHLLELSQKQDRIVIGQMSGTSLDGIDLVLTRLTGKGMDIIVEPLDFRTYEMPNWLRKEISESFQGNTEKICSLNYELGSYYGKTILQFCKDINYSIHHVDLIGLHGQTIWHNHRHSTLQIGEADMVAHITGTIVISDFRAADIAVGGSGAPLVLYADLIFMRNIKGNIAIQNLGGIGNVTWLPANREGRIIAFDTGPANAILNEAAELITFHKFHFDKDGILSKEGVVVYSLLEELLNHEYFKRVLPKSCGREEFGGPFVRDLRARHTNVTDYNFIRTLVAFVAKSIANSYKQHLPEVDRLFLCGGGAHNPTLFEDLKRELTPLVPELFSDVTGISDDAKEAVAFAIFAHERLNNQPCNVTSVTGAGRQVCLGKISMP